MIDEELKELGLKVYESEAPDRQLVDFDVSDSEDNVAWVWGDDIDDVEFECWHPHQCIEFGDGTEQGECKLCGSYCDFHYEEDEEGNKVPEAHEWYPRRNVGGLIREYLEELREQNG